MGNKGIYIVAKKFNSQGSLAYLCKNAEETRRFPSIIQKIQSKGVQLVILNSPDIYSEYAPYTYIENREEFIEKVSRMGDIIPS